MESQIRIETAASSSPILNQGISETGCPYLLFLLEIPIWVGIIYVNASRTNNDCLKLKGQGHEI